MGAGLSALAVDQATGRIIAATLTADSVRVEFPTQPAQVAIIDPASGHPVQTRLIKDGPEAVAIDETRGRAILITAENVNNEPGYLSPPAPGWIQTLQHWLPFLPWRQKTPSQVIGSVVDINVKQKPTISTDTSTASPTSARGTAKE